MGKQTLVKNFNFEENVLKVYRRRVQHLYLQDTSSVSLTNYAANFMEIDRIDAEHYDGKLYKHFSRN